ncbi:hypothetical protein L7F22_052796 [Adiantum nelumboides]|nr:hypothetical protein [Adiantum nelumboides]
MSRQERERDRGYDDRKVGSSSRRSKWDEEPEKKKKENDKDDYYKSERNERRKEYSRRDDGGYDKYRERRSERSEKDDRRYKNRNTRDYDSDRSTRRRSTSPSTSTQFRRDREKERQAYDDRYGTGEENSKDKNSTSLEPDFGASGLLAKESNNKNGVQLKYFEPPEARKPKKKWRLYVFKDGKEIEILHISRQSCYLIGRDNTVVDIPVDHQSISKQHAVIQFRSITERNEFGDEKRQTKPFLIDLDSANGTFVNKTELPSSRYYELRTGDTIKLGASQREYVLLAED